MTITKIERQKKDRNRCNLYIDGVFFCGLNDDTVLKFGIAANDEIDEKKLGEIRDFDEYIYGKKIAFDYLSYRIRTVSEIRKKLKLKKISEQSIEKVLKHLNELKLTNDEEFAQQLIREKLARNPTGKRVLKQKLFEKGISKEVSDNAIQKAFDEIDEKELALASFTKYFTRIKSEEPDKQRKKTFDLLSRRGFNFDVINEIIREHLK